MPPILISRPQLQSRHQLAVMLQFGFRQNSWLAMVDATCRSGFVEITQCSIDAGARYAVQLGDGGYLNGPLRAFLRQTIQPLAQSQQRLHRNLLTPRGG